MFGNFFENNGKLNDNELLKRFAETSRNRYAEALFNRYFHLVFGACIKFLNNEDDAKHAASVIFERLFSEAKKNQGEIKSLSAWLYSVSKNYCFSIIRDRKRSKTRVNEIEITPGLNIASDIEEDISTVNEEELYETIKRLLPQQRECIELFYLKEKSYKEITELTGYNLNEVKSYLQNGKRNLKLLLNKNER